MHVLRMLCFASLPGCVIWEIIFETKLIAPWCPADHLCVHPDRRDTFMRRARAVDQCFVWLTAIKSSSRRGLPPSRVRMDESMTLCPLYFIDLFFLLLLAFPRHLTTGEPITEAYNYDATFLASLHQMTREAFPREMNYRNLFSIAKAGAASRPTLPELMEASGEKRLVIVSPFTLASFDRFLTGGTVKKEKNKQTNKKKLVFWQYHVTLSSWSISHLFLVVVYEQLLFQLWDKTEKLYDWVTLWRYPRSPVIGQCP